MNKKIERELHGPSWTEVILGAVLSLILGVVLAAAWLVFKPVAAVREMPKEPAPDVVYYLEGSRDSFKARQASAKQRAFVQGESVELHEEELNLLTAPRVTTPAATPGQTQAAPAAAEKGLVTPGAPNFRIRDGAMQIGVPLELSLLGFKQRVIMQARGGFASRGERVVFAPDEFYVGSCPIQRLPFVEGMLMKRIMAEADIPEELATAWSNVSEAAIEGSTLQLTMR